MKYPELLLATLLVLSAWPARSQNYAIDWFAVNGGGGRSTGGVYQVSGTIGQPDAGRLAGGYFTLNGGFWGIVGAAQSSGAPTLRLFLTTTNTAVVAWAADLPGFGLQQNPSLGNTNWVAVTNAVSLVGSENQVTISPPFGSRFYRLIRQ